MVVKLLVDLVVEQVSRVRGEIFRVRADTGERLIAEGNALEV